MFFSALKRGAPTTQRLVLYSLNRVFSEVIKPAIEIGKHTSNTIQSNDAIIVAENIVPLSPVSSFKPLSDLILNSILGSLSGEYFPPPADHS